MDQDLVSCYFLEYVVVCIGDVRILSTLGARSPSHVTYTDPKNQNMMHTREDAIRSNKGSDLGHKTVRFQDPVGDMGKVIDVRVQQAFTEAVLDQLAANGADVKGHRRKLKKKQYAAVPEIEY